MGGANDREVPPVESGQVWHSEALSGRHQRGIHRPQGQLAVLPDQLGDPQPVTGGHHFHKERPGSQIADETHLSLRT